MIEAVPAPPLLATTATPSRGITATPIGFVPTRMAWPELFAILISATELQPNKVTKAKSCCGSMATPEGSGVGHAVLLTSMLCSTVRPSAFVTLPLESATSSANRRAEFCILAGTIAVSWRSPLPAQEVGVSATPSRRICILVWPDKQVSPLPMTVSNCGDGPALLPRSDEVVTNALGDVSVIENA